MSRDITITLKAVDEYSTTLEQFKTDVGGIGTKTRELGNSTKDTNDPLQKLGENLNKAAFAWLGFKGLQVVGDMIDIGQRASIASQTFEALTNKIGGAAENLEKLRQVTGGTVDDQTLLTGANKMLQMGLAGNTDELGKLSEMAVKLGGSMGMDATKAMSDFSLMLANNSIMRLDQFGISSDKVRTNMNRLIDTVGGIGKNEAFKLAVLEEGQKALERLGTAAEAAETPINRLKTNIQNIADNISKDFSTGANSLVGILEILTGNNPVQKQQAADKKKAEDDATAIATAYATRYHEALGSTFTALGTADLLFTASLVNKQTNPDMTPEDAVNKAFEGLTPEQKIGISDEDLQRMQQVALNMVKQKEAAEATAKAQQDTLDAETKRKELYDKYLTTGEMGDDRPHGAVDTGLGDMYNAVTGSDLAKTTDSKGNKLKPDEITSAMAKDIASINKDSEKAGVNIDKIQLALTSGATMAERIKNALDHLKTSQMITIHWSSDDPNGIVPVIKAVLGGGVDLSNAMAQATRDNGGVPPGSTGDHRGR